MNPAGAILVVALLASVAASGCLDGGNPTRPVDQDESSDNVVAPVVFDCPDPTRPCPTPAGLPLGFTGRSMEPSMAGHGAVLAGIRDTPPGNNLLAEPLARAHVYWSTDGRTWEGGVLPDPSVAAQESWWNAQWVHAIQDPTGRLHVVWDMELAMGEAGYSIAYATAASPGAPWEVSRIHTGADGRQPSVGWHNGTLVVRWFDSGSLALAIGGPNAWDVHTQLGPYCLDGRFQSLHGTLYVTCTNSWVAGSEDPFSLWRIRLPEPGVRLDLERLVARQGCADGHLVEDGENLWLWTSCKSLLLHRVDAEGVRRVMDLVPSLGLGSGQYAEMVSAALDADGTWHLYLHVFTQEMGLLDQEGRYLLLHGGNVTGDWVLHPQADVWTRYTGGATSDGWVVASRGEVWTVLGYQAVGEVSGFVARPDAPQ